MVFSDKFRRKSPLVLRKEEKEYGREADDAIGNAGKGHGSLHETLSLKPGRSCGRTGKTREKE